MAWFAAAAVLAFLFSFHKALSGWVAGVGGAVGSLYTAAAGFSVLVNATAVSGVMPLIGHGLQITPLNAIWLITLGLCGLFVSLYNIDWHRHPLVLANGLLVNLLMAAAVCAVVASNLGTLVVMVEIMALCAVFLTGCSKEGKLWFALGRIGTLLLAASWLEDQSAEDESEALETLFIEYLLPWCGTFLGKVEAHAATPFWRTMAPLTRDAIGAMWDELQEGAEE